MYVPEVSARYSRSLLCSVRKYPGSAEASSARKRSGPSGVHFREWTYAAPERPERSALASSEQILDAHSERGRNLVQGFDCGIRRFDFDGAHERLSDAGPGRQLGLRPSGLPAKRVLKLRANRPERI